MPQQAKLKIVDDKDVSCVSFLEVAILDESSIKEVNSQLEAFVKSKQDLKLVVNFSNVEYVSSAVLGMMVKILKLVKSQNGKMKLCAVKQSILQVFKITRLDKMFEIVEDEEKAVKSFKSFKLFGKS